MKFICYVTSRDRMVRSICDFAEMWPLIISHPSVKFDPHRSGEKEFIAFLICYMTLCDHVINKLWDFMDNGPALEPTTLSNLVAISLAVVEIQRFLRVTWLPDHVLKVSKVLMNGDSLLKISTLSSLAVISPSKFVMWFQVATWLQGDATLLAVVSQLNSSVCQVWWP